MAVNRAGILSTFASLCVRAKKAISLVQHNAARMAWCLLAVIAIPFPDPQMTMPKSAI
jgi:hypothetical protein